MNKMKCQSRENQKKALDQRNFDPHNLITIDYGFNYH